MKFRLTNIYKGQLVLEICKPVDLEGVPRWRHKRMKAVQSTSRHLIQLGEHVELDFGSLDACLSQPGIKRNVNLGRLRVQSVDEIRDQPVTPSLEELDRVFEPEPEPEEKGVEEFVEVVSDSETDSPPKTEKVTCELCGKKFKKITAGHLKSQHDMTLEDYEKLLALDEKEKE